MREENWLGNVWYEPNHFLALFGYNGIRVARKETELIESLGNNIGQRITIIALNVNVLSRTFIEGENNHWVGLVINRSESGDITGVRYIDPMGFPVSREIEDTVKRELGLDEQFQIEQIFSRSNHSQYAKIRTINSIICMEGNDRDCGPFLVEAFRTILQGNTPVYGQISLEASENLGRELRTAQRNEVLRQLNLNSVAIEEVGSNSDSDPPTQEL